jgi:spore maturation protein B
MKFILYLSDILIPLVLFYIIGYGILMKCDVYQDFVRGAYEGLKTVVQIMPTLIGLMVGVGVMRASGLLDAVGKLFSKAAVFLGFPSELMPLAIVRLFSSSAATGLVLDVYKNYGTDSYIGLVASIMMGCTETVFYTMSVYFLAAKITKSRWTLAGALLSTLVGLIASVVIGTIMTA